MAFCHGFRQRAARPEEEWDDDGYWRVTACSKCKHRLLQRARLHTLEVCGGDLVRKAEAHRLDLPAKQCLQLRGGAAQREGGCGATRAIVNEEDGKRLHGRRRQHLQQRRHAREERHPWMPRNVVRLK